jgi:carbon monoxide dehydrogenase subunit G
VAAPFQVSMHADIRRPPGAVWPFLVDWERLPDWMEEMRDVRVTSERRQGVGVEAEATVRIAGITTRDRIRVTRWDPPFLLEIAHLGWVKGTGQMELSPSQDGSLLRWRETLIPPWGLLGRLGMGAVLPAVRRVFRRDLQRLKRLVEDPREGGGGR